jgi:glycosyltransferase involved in cell wall biosynthesis
MRFHLLALPNTQTTRAYSLDGFSQATIRFARMMKSLGHEVVLYASEENEAPCDELVTVITKEEQRVLLGKSEYQYAAIDDRYPLWQLSNARTVEQLAKRKQPRDFVCLIGGGSQKAVLDAHPELMGVEYSIGYLGNFAKYRVFESYAWMHHCYGMQGIEDGRFFDTVIPVFFDPAEFEFRVNPEDYFLYAGRLVPRKGIQIACEAATRAGVKLKIIGHGSPELITGGHEYLGAVDVETRNNVMSRAKAVFCPTVYVEPFCCVAVEAQLCGTPVISTDFGGFTETVEQGKTGFRCSYLGEFVKALGSINSIDRTYVRDRAVKNYSIESVKWKYESYFKKLQLLWDGGWYSSGA